MPSKTAAPVEAPQSPPITSEYLTLQEAATYRRCAVRTLRRRIATGELPAFRDGGRILVRRTDLERTLRPVLPTAVAR